MKKNKAEIKVIVVLLFAGITASMFMGCQSKAAQAPSNTNQLVSADERKKQMEDNIKSLVTDGTINQTQADKITDTLTSSTQGFGGQRKPKNSQQNNNQNNSQGTAQNGSQNNRQNGQGFNPLSKLVSDGTITQAQADAVMQKIRGNFSRPQGNQNSSSKQ